MNCTRTQNVSCVCCTFRFAYIPTNMGELMSQSVCQSVSQSVSQSVNQSVSQSVSQSVDQDSVLSSCHPVIYISLQPSTLLL